MSGNKVGGMKTRDINLAKDLNFYKKIGALGGSRKGDQLDKPKGFGANRKLASQVGRIGGSISKRGVHLTDEEKKHAKLSLSIDTFLGANRMEKNAI